MSEPLIPQTRPGKGMREALESGAFNFLTRGTSNPYACHNRGPFRTVTPMQDGWRTTGLGRDGATREPIIVAVPMRANPSCQYTHTDLGELDSRCVGCAHRSTNKEEKA